jgi:FMN phosphatase YigB (HAD superfamily)
MDLDSTLLDLSAFKQGLFSTLAKEHSIPSEKVKKIYDEVKKQKNWPQLFAEKLHTEYNCLVDDFFKVFNENLKQIKLIQKSMDYMAKFEGKKYIFSFGDYEFQMQKINQFQLETAVDGIFITLDLKIDYLSKMIENDTVIIDAVAYTEVTLVDDDLEFLNEVHTNFPWIKTVFVTDIV